MEKTKFEVGQLVEFSHRVLLGSKLADLSGTFGIVVGKFVEERESFVDSHPTMVTYLQVFVQNTQQYEYFFEWQVNEIQER